MKVYSRKDFLELPPGTIYGCPYLTHQKENRMECEDCGAELIILCPWCHGRKPTKKEIEEKKYRLV